MADTGKTPRCLITIFLALISFPDSVCSALSIYKGLVPKTIGHIVWPQLLSWNLIWAPRETDRGNTEGEGTHNTATGHPAHLQVSVRTTLPSPCVPWIYSAINSPATQWFASMSPVPLKSFHFPEANCSLELILHTSWISTPPFSPPAEAECWSMPERMDSVLFLTSLCLHQQHHASTAHGTLLTQHGQAERGFPIFPLPKVSGAFC